jgi:hypothetical protein
MWVLVVAGAIALFLASYHVATRLDSRRPVLLGIATTTAALAVVSLLCSGPEPLGSFPAQRTNSLLPRTVVALAGAGVLVGGIALVFQAVARKSALTQVGILALAGLGLAIVGAFVAQLASCVLGVGCI